MTGAYVQGHKLMCECINSGSYNLLEICTMCFCDVFDSDKKYQDSDEDETFSISLVDLADVAKTIQPLEMWSGKKQATSLRPNPENVP